MIRLVETVKLCFNLIIMILLQFDIEINDIMFW